MTHPLDDTLGPMAPFAIGLLDELAALGIPLARPEIDHLCYRAASQEEYLALRGILAEAGSLLVEGMIGGRPIATYRFAQPLCFAWRGEPLTVPCIELAAPKPGRSHKAGLEHIELVVADLAALVAAHPALPFKTGNMASLRNPDVALMLASGQVKFHLLPLSAVIEEELATDAVVPVPADYFSRQS
ncbi:VOC family protein [Aeromonas crassostreae]